MDFKVKISDKAFNQISELMQRTIGLNLSTKKKAMVHSRLSKRLRELNLDSFDEYYQLLNESESELVHLCNLLTTNVTKFFREKYHFQFLQDRVLPQIKADKCNKKIRIWSAGCSSGEEVYSLAIILREFFDDDWDIKILATDINTEVLRLAKKGIYHQRQIKPIPYKLLTKYFKLGEGKNKGLFKVKQHLNELVVFKRLNLNQSTEYPIKSELDFVFCRNVFIYFKKKTREQVLHRFYNYIKDNGYLFLGHSESINGSSGLAEKWKLIQQTTYQKMK
ncbi:CheR family methyltransferase [Selenihalanaerobacter shriftii]|uniref:protein-glutamate O-methyltransferase n=1 Tax=Selenihalanaerobacter shriftii TaxID=142842 RepID=A0A1T4KES4_9FIRM|nr:protein-glutamate O-methyltransferase CheR [Selenihalanaerobacter shriftii]SJZ40910.1 chemotaxis protein methyltransferase CheR [Selenihalanaerobacter shriftii]